MKALHHHVEVDQEVIHRKEEDVVEVGVEKGQGVEDTHHGVEIMMVTGDGVVAPKEKQNGKIT